MNLEMNNFYGKVPDSFANNLLRNLLLNDNQLEGLLPRSLANCSSLEVLNLRNKLTDTFPYWLSSLPRLRVLILRSNRLHGTRELISLQALNLSNNNLTGPIPPSFGNTIALESLDLSSNKLGGRIPSQLTNLTFLAVSNLSQNALVGPIPHGKQFDTFENDSYSRNLRLCGLPLSKQCGNDEEPKLPVPMPKEDEGFEIAFIWKVVMMGYGCGVVLGLSMGYIVFTTGRPWWLSEWLRQIGKTLLLSGFAETEEDETSTTSTSCIGEFFLPK
ncbi:PREDICTED: systemin receptor SR160 [Theobroma cacao]|uniref:Systemin receptor SR160 n=1 Tax=Theobroma cacao TaxID=3641 RepID=A0AB32WJI7_THECC|nr:PREDICTED: systemin receptor SR160 [Theobroma cacao]